MTSAPHRAVATLIAAVASGWFAILRLRGPLEPWFEKTWRPGEIGRVQ